MGALNRLAYHFSGRNRHKKWAIFQELVAPGAQETILDVGFSDKEYSATDNYLEKNYTHHANITALGVVEPVEFSQRYPDVAVKIYDGRNFPFEDKNFDICWSNAVIEHVGQREEQAHFLREVVRVSSRAWITTPNLYFPIEVHTRTPFIHYLGKSTFDAYLRSIGKQWATGDYMYLLSRRDIQRLLADANITDYRLIANRLFGFVLEYIIVLNPVR